MSLYPRKPILQLLPVPLEVACPASSRIGAVAVAVLNTSRRLHGVFRQ